MNKGKARSEETKPNQENHRTLEFASIVIRDKPLEKARYESKKNLAYYPIWSQAKWGCTCG
jgi:hypothetical protein